MNNKLGVIDKRSRIKFRMTDALPLIKSLKIINFKNINIGSTVALALWSIM